MWATSATAAANAVTAVTVRKHLIRPIVVYEHSKHVYYDFEFFKQNILSERLKEN